jgi:putative hydrolase of the HAD superfamily
MVGNSLKSDILPALDAGAMAVHIPYSMTWAHEQVHEHGHEVIELGKISELPGWLANQQASES